MKDFDHDRLDVYRAAIDFICIADEVVERLPRGRAYLADQLQRAATSIVLNIAEGAGEFSAGDKVRFYRMAKRSATECAAVLDVARVRKLVDPTQLEAGRKLLLRIVSMLVRMARINIETGTGTGTGTKIGSSEDSVGPPNPCDSLRARARARARNEGTMKDFDHDRLDVYRAAIDFICIADEVVERLPRGRAYLADQLQRAATSIVLNIAEGAGEFSAGDKVRFYRMAKRSATECAAVLDVARVRKLVDPTQLEAGRKLLLRIVSMLVRMARINIETGTGTGTGTKIGEEDATYRTCVHAGSPYEVNG